ncbi:hypothetical protein BN1723_003596 [Verticillium longisporum]|uniref:Uncharacterized protein n=1 Tax=Verticillium longisporum TaxID=100787 RepID=A0A0G4M620_VERLO|nr:hypothetical protein BN1723_003596 [Verticillium longisporum]
MSDTISFATLDLNSVDIADAGKGPHQQAIDEPHALIEFADFAANGKALRSRSDVLEKAIEAQCRMLQKSKEIIRGLDNQVMSDLAVIARKNRVLHEKDIELLCLTKKLKKEGHEATVSDLLINDVAKELAHQHQKLKFAVYHANLSKDRQKLLLSLLEESLRHGQEPIQAVINNWKSICTVDNTIDRI